MVLKNLPEICHHYWHLWGSNFDLWNFNEHHKLVVKLGYPKEENAWLAAKHAQLRPKFCPPKATATKAPAAAGAPGATAPAAHGRRGSAPGGRNPLGVQLWQLAAMVQNWDTPYQPLPTTATEKLYQLISPFSGLICFCVSPAAMTQGGEMSYLNLNHERIHYQQLSEGDA